MDPFDIHPDITRAHTPPGAFYSDAELHARTKEQVFVPSWQLLGGVRERLTGPEAAVPFTLLPGCLDEHLLLVRDDQGQERCLSNVCTHRGMLLCSEPGPVRRLRCGYHGRCFDLTGRMTSMPEFEQAVDFPSPTDDLTAAHLEKWGPLTFAGLNPAVDFAAWLDPVRQRMDFLPLDRFVFDPARSRDYEVHANWALYCENYLEGFHIPFVHPELNKALDWQAYEVELHAGSSLQIGIADGEGAVFDLPQEHPDAGRKVAAYYWWLFPNLMLNFYPWGLSANIVEPRGPSAARVRFLSYVWREPLLETGAGGPLDAVEREDEAVVEAVQLGVGSRLYGRGRYSPTQEKGTHHFHRLLVSALFDQ